MKKKIDWKKAAKNWVRKFEQKHETTENNKFIEWTKK